MGVEMMPISRHLVYLLKEHLTMTSLTKLLTSYCPCSSVTPLNQEPTYVIQNTGCTWLHHIQWAHVNPLMTRGPNRISFGSKQSQVGACSLLQTERTVSDHAGIGDAFLLG